MPNSEFTDLTIEQQHVAIIGCCDALLTALRNDSSIAAIGGIRRQLAGLLHANLASEETAFVGPLRRLPVAERPRQFAELSVEAAELRSRYSEHVGHWSLTAIDSDPKGYARAAADLVRQVKTHLQRKRAVLPDWKRALA
jgi:hypothetical protein